MQTRCIFLDAVVELVNIFFRLIFVIQKTPLAWNLRKECLANDSQHLPRQYESKLLIYPLIP